MKRKPLRRTFWALSILLILWLIMAQSCMKFRISDREAKEKFAKAGVSIQLQTVMVDGFPMHFADTGNDSLPTLFFVQGSPGSWDAFSAYLRDKELLQHYRMVSIDRPGFGYSNFGDAKNLEEQSKLISPLLKLLQNNQPIYIIGHSLGGPMAVRLCVDNPGTFSGMVLLSASVDAKEEKPEKWRPWLYKTPLKFLVPGAFNPSNKELWFLKKDLVLLKNDFAKVTFPVWIMHGDKDNMVPVGNAAFAKEQLVNAKSVKVIIIPGANHFIPWEHYDEIKNLLLELNPG
ncbi:MAG: alpha/beta hydrolase [Bacteroidetes bacterium]|nr:alpha/beta hydrolase [Bacteroidota bacterium]